MVIVLLSRRVLSLCFSVSLKNATTVMIAIRGGRSLLSLLSRFSSVLASGAVFDVLVFVAQCSCYCVFDIPDAARKLTIRRS